MSDSTTKHCSYCNSCFPATTEYFGKDKWQKDGLYHRCKKCHNKPAKPKQQILPGFKQCTECHKILTYDQFYKDSRTKRDGLYSCCIPCFLKRADKWRKKDTNHTRVIALTSYYRNHVRRLESGRKYRLNNVEKTRERHRKYQLEHPDQVRANTLRRVARRVNAEGDYSYRDVLKLYDDQQGRCAYCGITLHDQYHVDHYIPLSKGGSNWPENLLIACGFCNCSKADKFFDHWVKVRGW